MARTPTTPDQPTATRLDEDTTKPWTTAHGDGPADTTDPTERATSIIPSDLSDEALAAGTVNAVKPLPAPEAPATDGEERVEEYDLTLGGKTVRVRHDLVTGKTERVGDVKVEV